MTRWTQQQLVAVTGRMKGGLARANILTPERRSEIAQQGAKARWGNKYGNTETTVDGIRFASKKESRRYLELKALKFSNAIRGFTRQVSLPLTSGKRRMIIDFMIVELDGRIRFEDTKGITTPAWAIKRDELEHSLGIHIEII